MSDEKTAAPVTTLKPHGDRAAETSSVPLPRPPRQRRTARKVPVKGPFVKYVGDASDRIIRPEQWRTLNIELKDNNATHTWGKENSRMIPCSEFSDAQLDYLLIDDKQPKGHHSFLEVDYDDEGNLDQV